MISTPLQESSLFIPPPLPKGVSQGGWSDLLNQIKDGNKQTADEQAAFAKTVNKDVVAPMKALRTLIKNHIHIMEKEIARLSEAVSKERCVDTGGAGAGAGSVALARRGADQVGCFATGKRRRRRWPHLPRGSSRSTCQWLGCPFRPRTTRSCSARPPTRR